jgi:hypothetical protein
VGEGVDRVRVRVRVRRRIRRAEGKRGLGSGGRWQSGWVVDWVENVHRNLNLDSSHTHSALVARHLDCESGVARF